LRNIPFLNVEKIDQQKRSEPVPVAPGQQPSAHACINEIGEWENKFQPKNCLEELDPNSNTTLPAIYNIMAMSARPLTRANW